MAFLRFLVIGFVLLTSVYVLSWFSLRRRRRRLLLAQWKRERPQAQATTQRSQTRMREWLYDEIQAYDRHRRIWLFVFVYLLPLGLVATMIYMTNVQ